MCDRLIDDIVSVRSPWGIVLLILNIVWPGLGTIINSAMGSKCRATTALVGVIQMLLAAFIIGWLWSIWWGVLILMKQRD